MNAGATSAGTWNAGATGAGTTHAGTSAGGGAPSGSGGTVGENVGGEAGASGSVDVASFPECGSDEDCEIAKDCCACQAVPQGTSMPACALACAAGNACDAKGLSAVAKCTLGRCTLATSCDERRVRCKSLPPGCPAGETVSVTELGCWGPCIAPTECSDVTDCAACGDAHCVRFPNIGGTTIRCVPRRASCEVGNLCQCLSPCGDFGCIEQNGNVGCFCAGC